MKKRNPIAKQIRNPTYRTRVVPNKRGVDETYDWVAEWMDKEDGETTENRRENKDLQPIDDGESI
tara:strand:+ start:565 stop:759 length:195 start_codon:yes stop_codon:yes gene_type:complete